MNNQALTIQEVGQFAPSALATTAHESRSDRYTYIPTVDVIEGMMKAGFQPFAASQSRSRIAGKAEFTKHMIRFRHEGKMNVAVGDVVPEVVLVNSHDGTSAYKLMAGLFRLVCANGMIVAESSAASLTVRHQGDVVAEVIAASEQIIAESQKSFAVIGDWSKLQLTVDEQLAFATAAHEVRFADSEGKIATPITPAQLLKPRRSADVGNDLWRTVNRVQENVIKGGLHGHQLSNGKFRAVTTRQVKGIDQDVKLNRAIWKLGETMAGLKGIAGPNGTVVTVGTEAVAIVRNF